ncbi:FAD-binding oxidoreductase [Novosphingobium sp. PhB165]|uniref:NAD(P)/FAD-dependent oxidoreductase n=1 Tax=Novosphingobium sp. PhB165 TaxID=2485105 RepID=UPI001FB4129B|nr:FAD-binding oxidoreductase [Novosphingobium sp. PhB165]
MRTAVVGGGVVGLSVGIELLDAGEAVTLIDDDGAAGNSAQAASWGNAGHIAVEQVEPLASMEMVRALPGRLFLRGGPLAFPPAAMAAWMPFGLRLLAASAPSRFRKGCAALRPLMDGAMPAWVALAERIGAPDLLRQDGHFVLWSDPRKAQAGKAAWESADTGPARVEAASPAEREALGKLGVFPVAGAVRFSGSGQIADLTALRDALRAAFAARGGMIVGARAVVRQAGGKVAVEGVEADRVVISAGVRSRGIMEALGHKAPMIAERGYHIRADAAGWPEDMPPVVFEERSMIVTRYRDCLQAASFVELGTVDAPADPRKWERLEQHVAELGLPVSGPFRRWMGCRPTLPDYLPAIGRSAKADNLYYAFGHQHLGLTLAPITGKLVAAMMAGEQPAVPLESFDIRRFG